MKQKVLMDKAQIIKGFLQLCADEKGMVCLTDVLGVLNVCDHWLSVDGTTIKSIPAPAQYKQKGSC